jgi:uncharacterized protein YbaP (TraB family)
MYTMNHFKVLAAFFLFCFTTLTGRAQGKSLLWQVSGNGLTEPSYLYGTVHVMCANDFAIKEKILKAFDKTQKLVVEVDLTDQEQLQAAQKLMISKTRLTDSLSESEEAKLDSSLKKFFNLSLAQVDQLEPMALESMMALAAVTCSDKKMYEMEFIQKAKQTNKSVGALETMTQQIDYLKKSFSIRDVVQHMALVPEYGKLFAEMIRYYKNEDLAGLETFAFDNRFMSDEARHWLLDVRNEDWVNKMPAMMKEGPTFFAVGAIHLVGNTGVLNMLKKEGYTVTPILN